LVINHFHTMMPDSGLGSLDRLRDSQRS